MPRNYNNMSMADLRVMAEAAADKKAEYDAIVKGVKAEVAIRSADAIKAAYKEKGVETGTARIAIEGVPLKINRSKTVEWDQDALLKVSREIPKSEARQLFKFSISIAEKDFAAIENDDIKAKIEAARKVKPGNPSIDFEIKV